MPYNTRRKSLSLPSLGIHIPVTNAARAAAAAAAKPTQSPTSSPSHTLRSSSPSSTSSSFLTSKSSLSSSSSKTTSASSTPSIKMASSLQAKRNASDDSSAQNNSQSSKRAKRSHAFDHTPFASSKPHSKNARTTPPPSAKRVRLASVEMDSPGASDSEVEVEIDMDAVNDDIVEAVILQLKATGNRPHLIKELENILMQRLKSVQQSANPSAIICSRLASFMKRPCWSAAKNCPLTKELETIHPRRTYYYLTTCPHQPLPDASSVHFIVPRTSIVTPPLSSIPSGSEATEEERRRELSPSPEVDLSSPEFDDFDDDIPMPVVFPVLAHHRGESPPLEKDEREFTQTAEGLQMQKNAGNRFMLSATSSAASSPAPLQPALPSTASNSRHHPGHGMDSDSAGRDELFDSESRHSYVASASGNTFTIMTSPAMRPVFSLGLKRDSEAENWMKLDAMLDWDRSPENVELEELDCLLDDF